MRHAYQDLLYFIMLFVTILVGFTGLAYSGLGRSVERYSSPILAFMSVFEMILGEFHWDDVSQGDNILGPIFTLTFMLMFMYVYGNIFIAILEIAYSTY